MSITEISDAAKNEIKSKSVLALGDTVTGKPAVVKSAIIEPVNVTVREINRIVGESNNSLLEAMAETRKYADDGDGKLNDKLKEQNGTITELKQLAKADRFLAEVVYDRRSASADLNRGHPNGLKKGVKISGLTLSKYRYLVIDCQFDRNITMFMNLTEWNDTNSIYINSTAGVSEFSKAYATIGFEVIVDGNKTGIRLNNAVRSSSYSSPSVLVQDDKAYVSKIIGII